MYYWYAYSLCTVVCRPTQCKMAIRTQYGLDVSREVPLGGLPDLNNSAPSLLSLIHYLPNDKNKYQN